MIRKATLTDLNKILHIVKIIVIEMKRNNNDQWHDSYPNKEIFIQDIRLGDLMVDADDNGNILSFFCLNTTEPDEYETIPWKIDKKALVIHRLAVNPSFQGRGLAGKAMNYAEEKAKEQGLNYLRSDTCVLNQPMNTLFKKLKYEKAGELRFPDSVNLFNCYEKVLEF